MHFNPKTLNPDMHFNPVESSNSNSHINFNPRGETPPLEKTRIQNSLLKRIKKKITIENKKECEKEITLPEIVFENNKSLGNDGLPAKFYKTFIDILKPDLLKLFMEISERQEMQCGMWQVVIPVSTKKR